VLGAFRKSLTPKTHCCGSSEAPTELIPARSREGETSAIMLPRKRYHPLGKVTRGILQVGLKLGNL